MNRPVADVEDKVLPQESIDPKTHPSKEASQPLLIRIATEPLLHFVLAGAVIYALFAWFGQSDAEDSAMAENQIVVTEGELDWLAESWQKRWNRPPTNEEMLGLMRAQIRETVLYREAISMGLDKDDTIIRRRLAQKLEFLAQDLIRPEPPTDEELQTFFENNIDRYRISETITFTHVFLDPDKRDDKTLQDAESLKAELIAGATVPNENSSLGDTFMLQSYYPERSEAEMARLFGREFAHSIMRLEPSQWHGPVLSGYGTHLVYVHSRKAFPAPSYDEVADRVRSDLEDEQRQRLNDEYIASLLNRYEVVVEGEDSNNLQAVATEVSQ